jgi:hypothetical protein
MPNLSKSTPDDPVLPKLYTATVACIKKVDGKCKGMLNPERRNTLQWAFEKAKYVSMPTQNCKF